MVQNNYRSDYLSDGFIILKKKFTKETISKLRNEMIDFAESIENDEVLLNENVRNLLLNKELINIIKEILNTEKILYYGDSNVVNHKDPFISRNGYHNDARNEDKKIPYDHEYPIIRVAIYFEDYKYFSGGLKIKKKSHKYFCFNFRRIISDSINLVKILFTKTRYSLNSLRLGKSINLELEQGDVVIWNLRTHHCGTSRRLKLFSKLCLQPFFEKLLPKFLFLPTQYKQDRCSIFATFAKNDLSNPNILGYVKQKIDMKKINQIKLNQDLFSKLIKLSLEIPDITKLNH
jgi:hypothetical protein